MRKLLLLFAGVCALAVAAPSSADGRGHGRGHGGLRHGGGGHGHGGWGHGGYRHGGWGHSHGHGGYYGHGYYGYYGPWVPRVVVGVGAPYWYGYGYAPWGYGGWWPPGVVERTVVREAPVYVERGAEPLPESAESDGSWYYCRSEGAYYPDVESCPEGWIPVPPRAP